jgi:hypothetical protein
MLIDLIFVLIDEDTIQLQWLMNDLDELVPFFHDDDGWFLLLNTFSRSG